MSRENRIAQKSIDVNLEMDLLRLNYRNWRKKQKENNKSFFIIYTDFLKNEKLKDINPTALKVYVYLGLHVKNDTGECWHSVETIADYFGMDKRTINRALENLVDLELIERIQKGFKRVANTFLKPY